MLQLKHPTHISIMDEGENFTIIHVQPTFGFQLPKDEDHINGYLKDARRIIDAESKSLNAIGLERLIAALIIEVRGNSYRGKHN